MGFRQFVASSLAFLSFSNYALTEVSPERKYALLISGRTEERHEFYLENTYKLLLKNNFEPYNIIILDNSGIEKRNYPVDGSASLKNIDDIMKKFSKIVTKNDLFFMYVTDHGSRAFVIRNIDGKPKGFETSTVELFNNENFYDINLKEYLEKIHPKIGILEFMQCYSGGFAQKTGFGNFVALSSSKENEVTNEWKKPNGIEKDDFANLITSVYLENSEAADLNNDDRVSLKEAFDLASTNQHFAKDQTPEIYYDKTKVDPTRVFLK